jgi:hypothetical protein
LDPSARVCRPYTYVQATQPPSPSRTASVNTPRARPFITFTNDTTHFTPHINPLGEQRRLHLSPVRALHNQSLGIAFRPLRGEYGYLSEAFNKHRAVADSTLVPLAILDTPQLNSIAERLIPLGRGPGRRALLHMAQTMWGLGRGALVSHLAPKSHVHAGTPRKAFWDPPDLSRLKRFRELV